MLSEDNVTVNILDIFDDGEDWSLQIVIDNGIRHTFNIVSPENHTFEKWIDFIEGKIDKLVFYNRKSENTLICHQNNEYIFYPLHPGSGSSMITSIAFPDYILNTKLATAIHTAKSSGYQFAKS
jgi:hypothetical protein